MPHNIFKEPVPVVFRQVLISVILQAVRLHFLNFDLESSYDKVRVYDGSDTTAPLLHTFSGTSRPNDVISTGNTVFVSFVTDSDTTKDGFKITYSTVIPVPGKLERFRCNSNDQQQWCVTVFALFPLNHACKNVFTLSLLVKCNQGYTVTSWPINKIRCVISNFFILHYNLITWLKLQRPGHL